MLMNEARFAIHYFRSQLINVFYIKFNMKELKLISKIVINLKKIGLKSLDKNPQD